MAPSHASRSDGKRQHAASQGCVPRPAPLCTSSSPAPRQTRSAPLKSAQGGGKGEGRMSARILGSTADCRTMYQLVCPIFTAVRQRPGREKGRAASDSAAAPGTVSASLPLRLASKSVGVRRRRHRLEQGRAGRRAGEGTDSAGLALERPASDCVTISALERPWYVGCAALASDGPDDCGTERAGGGGAVGDRPAVLRLAVGGRAFAKKRGRLQAAGEDSDGR